MATETDAPTDWADLIAHHPMFEAMGDVDRAALLSDDISTKHVLQEGEVILKQDAVGNSLFVVCDGSVSVVLKGPQGSDVELYKAGEGDVLGEMALFGHRLRAATLVTAEPSKLLEIEGEAFRDLMRKHTDMALYLLAKLSQRLRHTDDLILSRRITSLDGSMNEMALRLDAISQTTDAKLTAAQALFDQTNKRTAEVIHSAERRQSALKYIGAAAATVLGLAGFASYESITDVIDKIEKSGEQAKLELESIRQEARTTHLDFLSEIKLVGTEVQSVGEKVQGVGTQVSASLTQAEAHVAAAQESRTKAEDAAMRAGQNADTASENAKASDEAKEKAFSNAAEIRGLKREVEETEARSEEVFSEVVYNLLQLAVGGNDREPNFTKKTAGYYIDCITSDSPAFRSQFVDFLHQQIAASNPEIREGYIQIFEWALGNEKINFNNDATPELATNYFITLANVLQKKRRPTITSIERMETVVADSTEKDYFSEIFGTAVEAEEMIEILLLGSDDPMPWQTEALSRAFSALQG